MHRYITSSLHPQGIDLKAGGRNKKTARTAPKSDNVYLKLLVKVRWCSLDELNVSEEAAVAVLLRRPRDGGGARPTITTAALLLTRPDHFPARSCTASWCAVPPATSTRSC